MKTNFSTIIKYFIGTNVTSVTTLKADLNTAQWKKWGHAKVELGAGDHISNGEAIDTLVDFYNNNKGRRII